MERRGGMEYGFEKGIGAMGLQKCAGRAVSTEHEMDETEEWTGSACYFHVEQFNV